jgi:hypothetical protein
MGSPARALEPPSRDAEGVPKPDLSQSTKSNVHNELTDRNAVTLTGLSAIFAERGTPVPNEAGPRVVSRAGRERCP